MPFLTTPCRYYGLTPFDGKPLLLPQFFAEFLDLGVEGADLAAHLLVVLGFLGKDELGGDDGRHRTEKGDSDEHEDGGGDAAFAGTYQRGQAVVELGCRLSRAFMPFLTTPCRCYGLTPF